jgi:hypothetical protein
MEISLVRKRVRECIDHAHQSAAARRAANHQASEAWERLLADVAVPLVQQIAQVLKSEGKAFLAFTPAGRVRLASERSADDFIELTLDTRGQVPLVVASVNRTRGHDRISDEHILASGADIASLSDERLLDFFTGVLGPLVER